MGSSLEAEAAGTANAHPWPRSLWTTYREICKTHSAVLLMSCFTKLCCNESENNGSLGFGGEIAGTCFRRAGGAVTTRGCVERRPVLLAFAHGFQ